MIMVPVNITVISLKNLAFPLGSNHEMAINLFCYMYYRFYFMFPPSHWSMVENSQGSVIAIQIEACI